VLLDGGMGAMLLNHGLAPGDAPERMNLEQPEIVARVHAEYVEAGSEAVQTNTFGGHPIRLAHFGLAESCTEIHRRAVELARRAEPRFVIGDIGPTGEYLHPVGHGDIQHWSEGFEKQAAALIDASVDALHIETMSDLREAEVALQSVRRISTATPVLVSLTFDRKKRGFFTAMGDPLVESLQRLLEAGATVAGANCSLASGELRELAAEAQSAIRGRLVFQPNAGQPETTVDGIRYSQTPEEFATHLARLVAAGAAAIGGCCGTDPRFIDALRRVVERVAHDGA
jgi:5-methyltetrahydrofolate--homocysteine methyltransferase